MKKKYSDLIEETKISLYKRDYKEIRERWDKEDELLGSRTSMFLTVNAILFAATSLQENNNSVLNFAVSVVGFILTLLWLSVSKRSYGLHIFFIEDLEGYRAGIFTSARYDSIGRSWLYSYKSIAIILPVIVLLCWAIALAFLNITRLSCNIFKTVIKGLFTCIRAVYLARKAAS